MGTAWERHGMCESVFKTAGEQQGNGMGTAWERHGMCESALTVCLSLYLCLVLLVPLYYGTALSVPSSLPNPLASFTNKEQYLL
jgi:hypothetical protein